MSPEVVDNGLTAEVKALARSLGAKLVGIASVERFREAPAIHRPEALLPDARSVVVVGVVAWTDAALELTEKEIAEHWFNPYDICERIMAPRLDIIALEVARFLEARGYPTLPLPSTGWWRWRSYKTMPDPFAPPFVHRYAAVAAGLGEIGWHTSFLSPEYGPRQRLNSIITTAPLQADPLYDGPPLCDRCMACVRACPYGRFTHDVEGVVELDIGGKKVEVPRTNKWRCYLCYFEINPRFLPREINEEVALRITNDGRVPRGGVLMDSAACLAACMPPPLRERKPYLYPHTVARKRKVKRIKPADALENIRRLVWDAGVDYLYVGTADDLEQIGIELSEFMPTARAVVAYGLRLSSDALQSAAAEKLKEITFEVATYLQDLGHDALPQSRLPAEAIRRALDLRSGESVVFYHVLTSLALPSLRLKAGRPRRRGHLSAEDVKALAKEAGADLVGIASADRLAQIHATLGRAMRNERTFRVDPEPDAHVVGGDPAAWAVREIAPVALRPLSDIMPAARSVIVLGLHYPYSLAERAAQPPAENVGPYRAFVYGQTLRSLMLSAHPLIKTLQDNGYHALPTFDLEGAGFPQHQQNRFAAIAAGLGEIGWCGAVLTPEYGSAQRFLAIITDAEIEQDPLYEGGRICRECGRCVEHCPVGAISGARVVRLEVDGRIFTWGERDRLRCEWAHRFGLVGAEGPAYMGCAVDLPPPDRITLAAFREALAKLKQFDLASRLNRSYVFERCVASCPVRGSTVPA